MSRDPRVVVPLYLAAIENEDLRQLEAVLHPEVRFVERPNRVSPHGGERDRATILASFAAGQKLLQSQKYEILSMIADGDRLATESRWTAVLRLPALGKQPGESLEAFFGSFYTLRDGQIWRQVNYDCFAP